jgi:hypothetical protein
MCFELKHYLTTILKAQSQSWAFVINTIHFSHPIMTAELRTQLAESIDEAEFNWLKPHIQKDTVIIVNDGLDLVEVGVAIATDNTIAVQRWVGEQLITKPSEQDLAAWNAQPHQKFQAIIVQPYVLVQNISSPA